MIYFTYKTIEDVPDDLHWLHPQELVVFSKFKFEKRKNDWLLGRWAAKTLVMTYFSGKHSYEDFEIRSNADRAPDIYIKDRLQSWVVSISHSHGRAFCALVAPGSSVGCDLEKIESRSTSFVKDYYTSKEIMEINNFEDQERLEFINLLWSAKESVMKVLRKGMRIHPRKIELFSIENLKGGWNSIQMVHLSENRMFYGKWKSENGFVFVVMSDFEIDLMKI